ncbi:MAG: copper resistance CopC family protein [Canibacter sp.]
MSTTIQRPTSYSFTTLAAAIIAAIALALTGFLIAPSAAHAHDTLIGTEPGDQKVLDEAPGEVQLQFNNAVLDVGALIEVRDASDNLVSEGNPDLNNTVVSQPLQADLPDGAYRVVWRVVSSDGHPISGSFAFAVGTDGEAALAALPDADSSEDSDHDHGDEEGEHSHDHDEVSNDSDQADHDNAEASDNTQKVVWGSVIALVGVGVIIAVMIWFTRGSRKSTKTNKD